MGGPLDQEKTNSFSNERIQDMSDKNFEAGGSEGIRETHTRDSEEDIIPQPSTRLGKTKRHCGRWWKWYLAVDVVIVLFVTLMVLFVGAPRIAQSGVNESSLEVTVLKFLNPTEESVELTQGAILHSPSIFTPTLDSFSAGSYLITNGTFGPEPMIYIQMPKTHVLHPQSNQLVEAQTVKVNNLDQLTAFATAVVTDEYVTTALVGNTDLHEGHLPVTHVNYNTTSTYKALNGLKGFNVTNARINITAASGTSNFFGTAFVPNPSVMTIALGNVTLTLSTSGGVVGNSSILDMTLVPGDNNFAMTSIIDKTAVLDAVDKETGLVTLFIEGKDCVYNGQHITYYEKALSSNQLTLEMNVAQVIANSYPSK